jgi:hypothetical protein
VTQVSPAAESLAPGGDPQARQAPYTFPDAEAVEFSADEQEEIVDTILRLYQDRVQDRTSWDASHDVYDQQFRGQYTISRTGPWEGSSNLHIQLPYWLVDAINVRLITGVWSQMPLVMALAEEDDDQEAARDAARFIDWVLQPSRMAARRAWAATSKTRCIHGTGFAEIHYVKSDITYRTTEPDGLPGVMVNPDGSFQQDEEGLPIQNQPTKTVVKRQPKYQGTIMTALGWDDVITPQDFENVQPVRLDNPVGADYLGIRYWESLSLIWQKKEAGTYANIEGEWDDKEKWIAAAPSQDRSSTVSTSENQGRARQQDQYEGRSRANLTVETPRARPNPEFETLKWYMPWTIQGPDGPEEQEMVFFVCNQPKMLLGAFRLSDIVWTSDRPVLQLDYQRVPTRGHAMGVMELAKHLSAELDTIHNMRMDVGFATNLPFFFYRASSSFDPDQIEIKPLKGVPLDNIDDVKFPQTQNVTSFYHQEETLLYSLVERIFGITDLFLGISPTRGAAARHATGFIGTQQEAMARMSEVLQQDADEFGRMCNIIHKMELQFGPPARVYRLLGKTGPESTRVSREQLWMHGTHDFRLGANAGMFNSQLQQQKAGAVLELAQTSPFINGDLGRRWEAELDYLQSIGMPDPERVIGPKDAVAGNSPKTQDEENAQMLQYQFGDGAPAPTHPNDNDNDHLAEIIAYMSSPEYIEQSMPNHKGFIAHTQLHQQQLQRKMQMQQEQAAVAASGPGTQQPPPAEATGAAPPMHPGMMGGGIEGNQQGPPTGNGQPAQPNLTGA